MVSNGSRVGRFHRDGMRRGPMGVRDGVRDASRFAKAATRHRDASRRSPMPTQDTEAVARLLGSIDAPICRRMSVRAGRFDPDARSK